MEKLIRELAWKQAELQTRRNFLQWMGITSLGAIGLSQLASGCGNASASTDSGQSLGAVKPHFTPRAKRVIYIHMAGAPSQLELFDYKPELQKYHGVDCPAELLEGKKFAFIQGVPKMLGP
ncbi:MAG: DUF1501 domain-containing protein, partial [Spirosomataceae bacterium]